MVKLQKIVVQLFPNHPNGKMNRCWFVFTTKPAWCEVTDEQLAVIKADGHLKIAEEGKKAYELGLQNPAQQIGSNVSDSKKEVSDVWNNADQSSSSGGQVSKSDSDVVFVPVKAPEGKKVEKYNKPELVFGLQECGLVIGKDFQIDNNNTILRDLLILSREKNNK